MNDRILKILFYTILLAVLVYITSSNQREGHIDIISDTHGSTKVVETLVVRDIKVEQGTIQVNHTIHILNGYLIADMDNDRNPSLASLLEIGDTLAIDEVKNLITLRKIDNEIIRYRKKMKSDYTFWSNYWQRSSSFVKRSLYKQQQSL